MDQPLVFSVVIPTFNRAALIGATLDSVLRQTYPHFEVIVVDNCSTDKTEEVIATYVASGRVRFIKHDQNYERACSRNTGLASARGDFLTLLDSDDFMYPTNLQDAADFVAANPKTKCFHNLYEFVDAGHRVVYRPKFPDLKNQLKAIAQGNFMSCIGDFIHREIYTQFKFNTDPELVGSEDWEFWLRVLSRYEVHRLEKVNSGVRQHAARSISCQNLESAERSLQRVIESVLADPHLAKAYAPYLNRIEASSMMYLATMANSGAQYSRAPAYLARALKKQLRILTSSRFLRISQIALCGLVRSRIAKADLGSTNPGAV